jgi:K+-sensing histidine kinase KdpD
LLLTLAGTGICTAGAAIAAAVFTRFPGRAFVPIIFVVLIAISAAYFGAAAGMLGTLIAALVFATWLYAPIGGLAVQNPAARTALEWMVLGGVSLSFLLAPESPHKQ